MNWIVSTWFACLLAITQASVFAQSPPIQTPVLDVLPLPEQTTARLTPEAELQHRVSTLQAQLVVQTSILRRMSLLVEDLLQRVETLEKSQLPRQVRRAEQPQSTTPRRRYVAPRPSRDEAENLPGYWEVIP